MDTAELDHLTDSLTGTIASLRGLCEDGPKENAELVAAVTKVADGLVSIQSSIEGIRTLLAWLDVKSEGDADNDNGGTASGVVARCGPRFQSSLDVCRIASSAVIERLDVVVVLTEAEEEWGYESDWCSISDSVKDAKSTLGSHLGNKEQILKRVEVVIEPLSVAWEIIFGAMGQNQSKQPLLESSSSREVFRRLEKCSVGLTSADRRRPVWSAFLKPFRPKILMVRNQSSDELQSKKSRPSLARTKTWPLVLKNPVDPVVEEARKRSVALDRQIEADAMRERANCQVLLMFGKHESKMLLTDTAANISQRPELGGGLDLVAAADPSPVRKNLLSQANDFARIAQATENLSNQEAIWTNALAEKAASVNPKELDGDVVQLVNNLATSPGFRKACQQHGRLEAYDKIVLEAMSRAAHEDYIPTASDHRRFAIDHKRVPHRGTFTFSFDPISLRVDDSAAMCRGSRSKGHHLIDQFIEKSTSLLFLLDLAIHDVARTVDSPNRTEFSSMVDELRNLHGYPSFRHSRPSITIIFHNVKAFRERLKQQPFSTSHPKYTGPDDVKGAINYMIKTILASCKLDRTNVYLHVGELSSRSTVRFILLAAKESLLHRALVESGLF